MLGISTEKTSVGTLLASAACRAIAVDFFDMVHGGHYRRFAVGDRVFPGCVVSKGVERLLAAFLGILCGECRVAGGLGHGDGGLAHGTAFPHIEHFGGVVAPVQRDGKLLDEFRDIGVATDLLEQAELVQLRGEQDSIHRPGGLPHGGDGGHDALVRWQDKLLRRERLEHAVGRAAVGDRRADDGFFGDLIFGQGVFHSE